MVVRPTFRCLRDDLKLDLPPIDEPLDELTHPLVVKANQQFAESAGPRERIRSVDDVVLFKVKVQRWRGAVADTGEPSWLVAAGIREDGSRTDFYEALATSAGDARVRYNAQHIPPLKSATYALPLLPDQDDRDRFQAEAGVRLLRDLKAAVCRLVCTSLLDGREHSAEIAGAELGIQVQGTNDHATYVALRIIGSVPDNVVAVVLHLVPGCEPDDWYPEFTMPDRPLGPGEQVYSNLMDPAAAAQVLEDHDAR